MIAEDKDTGEFINVTSLELREETDKNEILRLLRIKTSLHHPHLVMVNGLYSANNYKIEYYRPSNFCPTLGAKIAQSKDLDGRIFEPEELY